jgi:response regulator RpfG family c-di-GMP phosphodiesterase
MSINKHSEKIIFSDETDHSDKTDIYDPWKILVVDDEESVHKITELALDDYSFKNRKVKLFNAFSSAQAKEIINNQDDIALVLLDIVMEQDNTGLKFIDYIRNTLNNRMVRIVIRTGHPGKAPEHEIIKKYDITDYKSKTRLTVQKLFTTTTSCLRAYHNLKQIQKNQRGLELIVKSNKELLGNNQLSVFARTALDTLEKIFLIFNSSINSSFYAVGSQHEDFKIIACTGRFTRFINTTFENFNELVSLKIAEHIKKIKKTGGEVFLDDEYIGVLKTNEEFTSLIYFSAPDSKLFLGNTDLIRLYMNNIATHIDNIVLTREIVNTQKEVIMTLGELVETRSKETANHVARVAEICYVLARKYGIGEEKTELLRMAVPMHDAGKIGIPEAILNKKGHLTKAEFAIVKTHARTGYDILKKSEKKIMETAALIALQHHEKWDGTGYPDNLAGKGIHIFGRIAAVADVFDALTHKRCYKDKWGIDKIINFFQSESGKHFDPDLVKILLSSIDEFQEINKQLPD